MALASAETFASAAGMPEGAFWRVEQGTVDLETGEAARISGLGRFDMNFAPRAAVVGESMLALVLADEMLLAGKIDPLCVSGTDG